MSITQNYQNKQCKVEGCKSLGRLKHNGKRYLVKGYCGKHYQRLKLYGNVDYKTIHDHRPAIIKANFAKIPIGVNAKDGYAIVDKEFAYLDRHKWSMTGNSNGQGYPGTNIDRQSVDMHRLIMGFPKGLEVDHINRNRLDNRLTNLRLVNRQQNSLNKTIQRNNPSGYKGVSAESGKWRVKVVLSRVVHFGGLYACKHEAARAYNDLAVRLHGKYAALNKIKK